MINTATKEEMTESHEKTQQIIKNFREESKAEEEEKWQKMKKIKKSSGTLDISDGSWGV